MLKNSNNASVKKLSDRSLKANKTRNIFAILAIMLTTVLFITVTTLMISILEELEAKKSRDSGTTAHGYVMKPTKEEFEDLKRKSRVKSVGEVTQVTKTVENSKMASAKISLCYLDKEALAMKVYDNFKGKWPSDDNEIAIPTWVLDKMGMTYTLGQKVTFSYEPIEKKSGMDNKKESKEFVLSAYYTEYSNLSSGDRGFAVVSKEFRDKLGGNYNVFVTLKSKDEIKKNFEKVCKELGIEENRFKVNSAYLSVEKDNNLKDTMPYAAMMIIILACGYLLIYNIFYISVSKDIKFYGMLKTLGTTSKQLKAIIRKQCLKLCVIGIPLGCIVGYSISFIIVPLAMRGANVATFKVSFNPLIFILTIAFTLVTVILACRKPAKMAGKVSPIEALRYTAGDVKRKKGVKKGSKGAKIYKMAWGNIFRDRKRAVIVILSLTLGFTCFLCAATFSKSLQADGYIKRYSPYDFRLENKLFQDLIEGKFEDKEDYLNDKVYGEISKIDGIKNLNRVNLFKANLEYKGVLKANSDEMFKTLKMNADESGVRSNILGLKENSIDYIDKNVIIEGTIDKVKFKSGEYVIISNVFNNAIKVGNKINIGTESNPKNVEVMAVLDGNPYTRVQDNGPDILIEESYFKKLYPKSKTLTVTFDVKDGSNEAVYAKLKEILGDNANININAKHIQKQFFINAQKGIFVAVIVLASAVAIIGALNFINTMVTSINARKVELAMLESVGMTKKQMKKMLTLEGIFYGSLALIMVATIGNVLAYFLIEAIKFEADYAIYYFPIMPLILIAIIVVLTAILVPKIILGLSLKESVVERLREVN